MDLSFSPEIILGTLVFDWASEAAHLMSGPAPYCEDEPGHADEYWEIWD